MASTATLTPDCLSSLPLEFSSTNSVRAVVAHILASTSPQPNAFGAKIAVSSQLNISVWRHYLTDYADHDVVDFLQFGWPINYDASVLPQPTHTNDLQLLPIPRMYSIIYQLN